MEYAQLIRTIMRNWTIRTTLVCFNLFLFANLTVIATEDGEEDHHIIGLVHLLLRLTESFVFAFWQIRFFT